MWNARAEDGRRRDSFHSGRFIYFFFFTSRPFVSLFTHRRFPLPFSFYERGIIRAQQALDSHFYANWEDCSCIIFESHFFFTREIVNFRKENLSRDACSGIVNRNIDNYGHNVSRTMYH